MLILHACHHFSFGGERYQREAITCLSHHAPPSPSQEVQGTVCSEQLVGGVKQQHKSSIILRNGRHKTWPEFHPAEQQQYKRYSVRVWVIHFTAKVRNVCMCWCASVCTCTYVLVCACTFLGVFCVYLQIMCPPLCLYLVCVFLLHVCIQVRACVCAMCTCLHRCE